MQAEETIADIEERPGWRILVVDDSRLQRRVLAANLARWGYTVIEADSGEEALQRCHEQMPDMVLSDWMMPGMNGLEFCRAFRDMSGDTYGYFILLTSKAEKNDVATGLEIGADDFLTKPVNSGELRARLSAGERIIDMQRELTRKNRLIAATLRELQQIYDEIDTDLLEAKKLQQSLVRERLVEFEGAQVAQILRSAGRVGGDLVGHYPVGPHRVVIYAIDVSGHGISSALMTARLAGMFSASVPSQNIGIDRVENGLPIALPPDEVAARLNVFALRELKTEHYFTLALAEVDLLTGRIRMVQAGHPHPMIQRANGKPELLGQGGLPIGLIEGATYDLVEARLAPGERLLMVSDGITEARLPDGTMLAETGTLDLVESLREQRGTGFMEALVWTLADRMKEGRFDDDVSAILLEYLGR